MLCADGPPSPSCIRGNDWTGSGFWADSTLSIGDGCDKVAVRLLGLCTASQVAAFGQHRTSSST